MSIALSIEMECYSADFHYTGCQAIEHHYSKCCYSESPCIVCLYAVCHYAWCYYDKFCDASQAALFYIFQQKTIATNFSKFLSFVFRLNLPPILRLNSKENCYDWLRKSKTSIHTNKYENNTSYDNTMVISYLT